MDHIHIQKAIEIVHQKTPKALLQFYQRSSRNELLLLGGTAFLTIYNLAKYINAKRQKLHLPPRVAYALPVFGHSLYMLYDSNRFLDWCTKTYGEVYDIKMLGKTITVAGGRSGEEVLKAEPDYLSIKEGILTDVLYLHYAFDEMTFKIAFTVNPPVARSVIPNSKMGGFTANILKGMDQGLEDLLPQEVTTVKDVAFFLQRFVAYMSVPSLVGPEVATNPEVLASFADFTGDITSNIGIFMATPKWLHKFITPYLQSFSHHRRVMVEHVIPVIKARRQKMAEAAAKGEPHNLTPTFLQGLIEHVKPDGTTIPEFELSQSVLMIAFASVHTTSMNLSFSLYWLLARPDLRKRMMDEIETVLGDDPITMEGLEKMPFLESFVREVLRQGVDKLANGKKALKTFTFSNGFQIPKGRLVESTNRQLNFGSNSNRSTIDSMNPDMSTGRAATTPNRDFVSFGLGKHLCPGRFFAVHEIKLSLITLLRNYDITTANGKRPEPINYLGGIVAMNCTDPLVFTKRH
ncbi:cytochrome P450 [Radiomyces spectabilis]|uniref:cytochrome P450 n=1 Tax=Radiomyces spectabilis TaxID=64574 RepID=UPI00221F3AFF|nr:cytochrome P450 [Radiomyces spectabilis]KAI8391452.1 cytochrome P450 [Radiomyces spectabilis]